MRKNIQKIYDRNHCVFFLFKSIEKYGLRSTFVRDMRSTTVYQSVNIPIESVYSFI